MTLDSPDRLESFLEELRQMQQIYRKLIELTENQSRVIVAGVTEEVIRLAEDKSRELERLERLEPRLEASKAHWRSVKESLQPSDRDRVLAVIHQVEETLRRLLELEEEEGHALRRRRDETEKELKHLDNSRRLHHAYGPAIPGGGHSIDQRE